MTSFFEKLKKGMGVEVPIEEEAKEKQKPVQEKKRAKKTEIIPQIIESLSEKKG